MTLTRERIEEMRKGLCLIADRLPHSDNAKRDLNALCDLALAGLRSQWIPVSERLPEPEVIILDGEREECDFVPVLFYTEDRVCAGRFWPAMTRLKRNKFVSLQGREFSSNKVTHWMPLPEPPARKEGR